MKEKTIRRFFSISIILILVLLGVIVYESIVIFKNKQTIDSQQATLNEQQEIIEQYQNEN